MNEDNFQINTTDIEDLMSDDGSYYEEEVKKVKSKSKSKGSSNSKMSKNLIFLVILIILISTIQLIPIGSDSSSIISGVIKTILMIVVVYLAALVMPKE